MKLSVEVSRNQIMQGLQSMERKLLSRIMTSDLHFKICSGCFVEKELEGQKWKQRYQLEVSCNYEMMVTWTRKVVVELERNRPIFEVVTIGFVDELKVWDEGQERNQG